MWSRISRRISSRSAGAEGAVVLVLVDRGVTVVDEGIEAEAEVGGEEEEVRGEGEEGVVEVEVIEI